MINPPSSKRQFLSQPDETQNPNATNQEEQQQACLNELPPATKKAVKRKFGCRSKHCVLL
jgi:hypothetical protein